MIPNVSLSLLQQNTWDKQLMNRKDSLGGAAHI
jgi:hypothetical protein